MGRFRIHSLIDGQLEPEDMNDKTGNHGATTTEWTLLYLYFRHSNYGTKFVFDQIDTPDADMCFTKIMIIHSVY